MASTITNISNNIDITFPLPGVDNDSQGFRSNFTSIKNSLKVASDEISRLQTSASTPDLSGTDFLNLKNSVLIGTTNQEQYDGGYNLGVGAFIFASDTTPSMYGMASPDQDIAIIAKENGAVRVGPIGGFTAIHNKVVKTSVYNDKYEVQLGTTGQTAYDNKEYKLAIGKFILGNEATEANPSFYGLGSPDQDIAIIAKTDGAVRIGPIASFSVIENDLIKTSELGGKYEVQLGTTDQADYDNRRYKIAFGKFIFGTSTDENPTAYGIVSADNDIGIVSKSDGAVRIGPIESLLIIEGTAVYTGVNNQKSLGTAENRWSTVYATNGTIQTSDVRLKTNIEDLPQGLAFVNDLRPVRYSHADDLKKSTHWGLIAQEVKQTIDNHNVEFAGWSESDDELKTQSLNYSEFIAPLIKSVQELSAENRELKNQIEEIKKHLGL